MCGSICEGRRVNRKVPFDFAQGRLSTRPKSAASLEMTAAHFFDHGHFTFSAIQFRYSAVPSSMGIWMHSGKS